MSIRSPFFGPRVRLLPASNLRMDTVVVREAKTINFPRCQGIQRVARRRTMGTPHKEPGRLTPRSRKRAVFGRELNTKGTRRSPSPNPSSTSSPPVEGTSRVGNRYLSGLPSHHTSLVPCHVTTVAFERCRHVLRDMTPVPCCS